MEPIHLVTYVSDEPTDALIALGLRNYWDGYFAGRATPLGRVPVDHKAVIIEVPISGAVHHLQKGGSRCED